MSFHRRIATIYGKELIDILRDHRTLIAMIVVPIVLYPLLMLGSIQAVSYQVDSLDEEPVRIGVLTEDDGRSLNSLIQRDAAQLAARKAAREAAGEPVPEDESDRPLEFYNIGALQSLEELKDAIRARQLHVGVLFERGPLIRGIYRRTTVRFLADTEHIRSYNALMRLRSIVERTGDDLLERRLVARNIPRELAKPFVIDVEDLATPTSMLGQILPLILILLTITGAIYPAIDLTAGERERGTLETLMVCPVPVIDLIVGKFLVVTTVAILGAMLNLASVSATVYFGGFNRILSGSDEALPFGKMAMILAALIPFAVLMSAVMIAVCSYARTFKEAQNYVTPVILAVLIPGGIAALPATELEGVMLVMPVGNMVLLARDLLLETQVEWWQTTLVLLSTTMYAAAAVAVAASIFGKESVVFADSGSLKGVFSRRLIRPSSSPSVPMSLLVVSLMFPTWFFIQSTISPGESEDATNLLQMSGLLMPLLFVGVPLIILLYWRTNVLSSFALRAPRMRDVLAAALIGLSAPILAHELNVLQSGIVGVPEAVQKSAEDMTLALQAMPVPLVLLLLAVVPAVCEELLFRGFLFQGLLTTGRRGTAVLVSAAVFAVFHFVLFKFLVTGALGLVLAYLCLRTRSVLPGMIVHLLYNGLTVLAVSYPSAAARLGIIPSGADDTESWAHLPAHLLIPAGLVFVAGLLLISRSGKRATAATRG